jgi:hypothetical protein
MTIPRLTSRQAINGMIAILSISLIFHLLVLLQIVPYSIVWAGKLNSVEEMRRFETVSIGINLFMLMVMLLKASYIRHNIPVKILNWIIWIFVIAFALNTAGNLFSKTSLELYAGTTLTFLSTLLCYWIVTGPNKK